MMLDDLPYPQRLCVELLHYAIISPRTGHMKCAEVKAAIAVFFGDDEVDAARAILTGESPSSLDRIAGPPETIETGHGQWRKE